jgi:pimeloyl-ACP methyl ester carboxylesterase
MSHGNNEDIGHLNPEELSNNFSTDKIRVNVCVYDYAGYGLHSDGTTSECACYRDVYCVYRYLVDDIGIDPKTIILYGRSLGTAVSAYLCNKLSNDNSQVNPMGLILVSPLQSVIRNFFPNVHTSYDIFKTYQYITTMNCRTLILHGYNDRVVPHYNSEILESLLDNYVFITLADVGHNDIHKHISYYPCIKKFIESLVEFCVQ